MTEDNTQPVIDETEAQVQPAAEAPDARNEPSDDLDSFLSEFENQTKPQPQQTQPPSDDLASQVAELRRELDQQRQLSVKQSNKDALAEAIKDVRGDLDLPDFAVKGFIYDKAEELPKLNEIFENRSNDPAAWKKAKARLRAELAKEHAKVPDRNATEDKEAVTAAMRGTTTRAPEEKAPHYGAMNDAELRAEMAKLGL